MIYLFCALLFLISTLRRRVICRQRGGSINRPYIVFTLAKIRPYCGKHSIGTATPYSARRPEHPHIHSFLPRTSQTHDKLFLGGLLPRIPHPRVSVLSHPHITYSIDLIRHSPPTPLLPQPTNAANDHPPGRPETIYKPLPTNGSLSLSSRRLRNELARGDVSPPRGLPNHAIIQVGPLTGEVLVPSIHGVLRNSSAAAHGVLYTSPRSAHSLPALGKKTHARARSLCALPRTAVLATTRNKAGHVL